MQSHWFEWEAADTADVPKRCYAVTAILLIDVVGSMVEFTYPQFHSPSDLARTTAKVAQRKPPTPRKATF